MEQVWVIIKDNYVIDRILWDGVTEYSYPFQHDFMIQNDDNEVCIGDFYDTPTKSFTRTIPGV
jgi:hypothetical protein